MSFAENYVDPCLLPEVPALWLKDGQWLGRSMPVGWSQAEQVRILTSPGEQSWVSHHLTTCSLSFFIVK